MANSPNYSRLPHVHRKYLRALFDLPPLPFSASTHLDDVCAPRFDQSLPFYLVLYRSHFELQVADPYWFVPGGVLLGTDAEADGRLERRTADLRLQWGLVNWKLAYDYWGNGLVPNRWQVNISINDVLFYKPIHAYQGKDDLHAPYHQTH